MNAESSSAMHDEIEQQILAIATAAHAAAGDVKAALLPCGAPLDALSDASLTTLLHRCVYALTLIWAGHPLTPAAALAMEATR